MTNDNPDLQTLSKAERRMLHAYKVEMAKKQKEERRIRHEQLVAEHASNKGEGRRRRLQETDPQIIEERRQQHEERQKQALLRKMERQEKHKQLIAAHAAQKRLQMALCSNQGLCMAPLNTQTFIPPGLNIDNSVIATCPTKLQRKQEACTKQLEELMAARVRREERRQKHEELLSEHAKLKAQRNAAIAKLEELTSEDVNEETKLELQEEIRQCNNRLLELSKSRKDERILAHEEQIQAAKRQKEERIQKHLQLMQWHALNKSQKQNDKKQDELSSVSSDSFSKCSKISNSFVKNIFCEALLTREDSGSYTDSICTMGATPSFDGMSQSPLTPIHNMTDQYYDADIAVQPFVGFPYYPIIPAIPLPAFRQHTDFIRS